MNGAPSQSPAGPVSARGSSSDSAGDLGHHPGVAGRRRPADLSDRDILAVIEDVYEYACWAADCGMIAFDAFAGLADVLRELRLRVEP